MAVIPARGFLTDPQRGVTPEWLAFFRDIVIELAAARDTGGPIDASRLTGAIDPALISGLTDEHFSVFANIAWDKLSKLGSSFAHLGTRDASDIADGSVDNTEFQYLDGAVSNIQQQIDEKLWHPLARKWVALTADATALVGVGLDSGFAISGAASIVAEAGFAGRRYTSGAVSGNQGGISTNDLFVFPTITDWVGYIRMRTGSNITNLRLWVGLTSFPFVNADSAPIANRHSAAFRYSTPAGDGGWVGFSQAGVGATFSVTPTVAPIQASTEYLLRIRVSNDGTQIHFSVDGGPEQTLTTNLPSTTATFSFHIGAFTNTAAAVFVDFSDLYLEYHAMKRAFTGVLR